MTLMRLANFVLGKKSGDVEETAVDVHEALMRAGGHVVSIIEPGAWISDSIHKFGETRRLSVLPIGLRPRFRSLLREVAADAVIAHGVRAANIAARLAPSGIRVIAFLTGSAHGLDRRVIGVLAPTEHIAESARKGGHLGAAVAVVPLPIRRIAAPVERRPHTPTVIGILDRLDHQSGVELAIRAVDKLRDKGVETRLLVGGTGAAMPELHKLTRTLNLEDQVRFAGWVFDPGDFLSEIDLFCAPRPNDAIGRSLLKAKAAGVPSVAAAASGPRHLLTQGVDGLLVTPDSHVALAEGLEAMISEPGRAIAMGNLARETAAPHEIRHAAQPLAAAVSALLARTGAI